MEVQDSSTIKQGWQWEWKYKDKQHYKARMAMGMEAL